MVANVLSVRIKRDAQKTNDNIVNLFIILY